MKKVIKTPSNLLFTTLYNLCFFNLISGDAGNEI